MQKSGEHVSEVFTSKGITGWCRGVGNDLITPLLNSKWIAKTIIAATAVLFSIETKAELQSGVPLDAYGVWDRTAYTLKDDTYLHLFRGLQLGYAWSEIEPENDKYDWRQLDKEIKFAADSGLYAYINVGAGPACPDWVYNTVPKLLTDKLIHGWTAYPYYYHEDFKTHFFDMISDMAAHIASLDPKLREKIVFCQPKMGCTGDPVPVKGEYLPESPYKLYKEDAEWQNFRIATFQQYKDAFEDNGLDIPLLMNGIGDEGYTAPVAKWVKENIGSGYGVKGSSFVRGHHLPLEGSYKKTWYDKLVNPKELALFSRAEMDQSNKKPVFLINRPLGFYWGMLGGLNTGLSICDFTGSAIRAIDDHPEIVDAIEFFNRYAGQIYPATATNAYSILHEGLDAADVDKFPENKFGKAQEKNQQRYINICKAYAHRGAQMDDPSAATRGKVYQRDKLTGYNDAGWDIHAGNYERWIEQIDPEGTSIGLFRLNADSQGLLDEDNSIYDRFARSFETSSGKNAMYFKFHDETFSKASPDTLTFNITWLDKYKNSTWAFQYDDGSGTLVTAKTFTGIGDNKWKTETIVIDDAAMQHKGPKGSDFALVNTDGIDDIFHGIEVDIVRDVSGITVDVAANHTVEVEQKVGK